MAFTRVRTINGKQYLYEEFRWREGGKVRSRSKSLGPLRSDGNTGWLRRQIGQTYGIDWDAIEKEALARQDAEDKVLEAHLDELHCLYGLKLGPPVPVEIEKPATSVDLSPPAGDENASPDGEADINETQDQ